MSQLVTYKMTTAYHKKMKTIFEYKHKSPKCPFFLIFLYSHVDISDLKGENVIAIYTLNMIKILN